MSIFSCILYTYICTFVYATRTQVKVGGDNDPLDVCEIGLRQIQTVCERGRGWVCLFECVDKHRIYVGGGWVCMCNCILYRRCVLQCVAVCCIVLQRVAVRSSAASLQHTATHCNTLQHTATYCNTLQHTATHSNTLQHTPTHSNTLQHTPTQCNTLQHTATHCNTLQQTCDVLTDAGFLWFVSESVRGCGCVSFLVSLHEILWMFAGLCCAIFKHKRVWVCLLVRGV